MKLRTGVMTAIFLIFIIFVQFSTAAPVQAAILKVIQTPTDEEIPEIRTINVFIDVFTANKWKNVNNSELVLEITNNTPAKVRATFFNEAVNVAILQALRINIYNASSLTREYLYQFPSEQALEIKIPSYTTRTQDVKIELLFNKIGESFVIAVGFDYFFISNRSEILTAFFHENFTLNVGTGEIAPPEFLVIIFYGITILIIAHLSLGFIGRRQTSRKVRRPKFSR